jgi:hypothetical protein
MSRSFAVDDLRLGLVKRMPLLSGRRMLALREHLGTIQSIH